MVLEHKHLLKGTKCRGRNKVYQGSESNEEDGELESIATKKPRKGELSMVIMVAQLVEIFKEQRKEQCLRRAKNYG